MLFRSTEFSEGEMILTRGESVDKLILIFIGEMAVEIEGKNIANLHSGSWVGEMSFINNEKASADVRVVKMAKCVYWDRKDINRFLKNNDQLRSAFYHILGVDIVKKIATISERQRDWKGG